MEYAPGSLGNMPSDRVDNYDVLQKEAAKLGAHIGAINPNMFQEYDYKLGSVGHCHSAVRHKKDLTQTPF